MRPRRTPATNIDNRSGIDGFSVIEVIIAALIVSILCIGVLTVFSQVVNMNRGNATRLQALQILDAEVDSYRSMSFAAGAIDSRLIAGTATPRVVSSADGTEYSVSVEVVDLANQTAGQVPAAASVTLKRITISVSRVSASSEWSARPVSATVLRVRA
jgi:Tfp pilus assembly protein PilV